MQRYHLHSILSFKESHIINKLFTRNVCSAQENLMSYFSALDFMEHVGNTIARSHYDSFLERPHSCLLSTYTVIL